jgi:bzd-type benzoyl-CoA reductase N subunit
MHPWRRCMMTGKSRALTRVEELSKDRGKRARELKREGKKIIGYFCCYPPVEIMSAAGVVPFRIGGDLQEPVTEADAHLETLLCPYWRSSFDLALKGRYEFLDGLVSCHSCNTVEKLHEIWKYYIQPPYTHFIMVPHVARPPAIQFYRARLVSFMKSLGEYLGVSISREKLSEAVELHNKNRALIRELYKLRKADPPLLSGAEMTQILMVTLSIPVEESNKLLRELIPEIKQRGELLPQHPRLLVWGGPLDEASFIRLIEECGANVVIDDTCIGTRPFWSEVEPTSDPLDGISLRYLDRIPCPRTLRDAFSYRENLARRFGHLLDFASEFRVKGAIIAPFRFCDSHLTAAPGIHDYLQQAGYPALLMEFDYDMSALMPLKTRIQAFLEMIG